MIDGLLLLGVGLLGLAVGVVLTLALRRALQPHELHPEPAEPELDEETTAVLAALRSATVVVSVADGRVVRSSPGAHAFAVVRGDRVAHAAVDELIAAVARDGRVRDADVELPRGPVGSGTVALALRVAPLGAAHVLLLAEDRTEARRVEAIRRDFVVNVSHELKTPVGALSLLAETVEEAAGDPVAVRRFAGRIQTEATRLSALVHEIIELSRLQVVDALREAEPVDLGEVLHEAVDRARTKALAREIAIDLGADPGVVVLGDRDLLVTAVRNLLDNAVAYSETGTRVAVGTSVRAEQGLVEIAVVDQGMGIPAEAQPRLFERFYRVDPARSRDTGGTGLGLSIVKHVATDHGGDVAVWSEPGRGSTFTIRLPIAHVPGEPRQDAADTSTDEGARR